MKTKPLLSLFFAIAVVTTWSGFAQTENKPLTNADVVQMVKAHTDENVIVLAIQANPANYDTSPAALMELRNQGVSAKIQEAMLKAEIAARTPPTQTPQAAIPPSIPANPMVSLNRVFLLDGTNRIEMMQNKGVFDTF